MQKSGVRRQESDNFLASLVKGRGRENNSLFLAAACGLAFS